MSNSLLCPRCEYRIRATDAAAGTAITCPSCRGRVEVPAAEQPAEPDRSDEGEWADDSPPPKKRSIVVPLVVGGGLAFAVLALGLAITSATGGRPNPRPTPAPPTVVQSLPPTPVTPPKAVAVADLPGPPVPEVFDDPFRPAEAADAQTVAALDEVAKQWPLPQDAARAAKLREARLQWAQRTLGRAFERAGQTDAAWAKPARDALALKARDLAIHPEFGLAIGGEEATQALAAAVAAGCDDPLVLYFHHRTFLVPPTAGPPLGEFKQIARRLWDSGYHDIRKAQAAQNLVMALRAHGGTAADIAMWESRFWEALGRAARDPDPITQDHVIALADLRDDVAAETGGSRLKAHEEFVAALERVEAPEYTRKVVRGNFLIGYAWDARGSGAGATVGANAFKLFGDRLAAAEAELTAAFELDPTRLHAPTRMIAVCMGRGHPRREMERWFERALTADPDNAGACRAKLLFLEPKWHGSRDGLDMLGFAWQCARTANTAGMLPYVAFSSTAVSIPLHDELTPDAVARYQQYYADPLTWTICHAALTVVRRARPELTWLRGEHARAACFAGRTEVAKRVLGAIGPEYAGSGFASAVELAYYRTWAKTGRAP